MSTSGQDGDTPLTSAVPAVDAVGQASVYRHDDEVVLQVPGEGVVLPPDQARALADRLYEQAEARPRPSGTVVPLHRKARPSRPRTGSGT